MLALFLALACGLASPSRTLDFTSAEVGISPTLLENTPASHAWRVSPPNASNVSNRSRVLTCVPDVSLSAHAPYDCYLAESVYQDCTVDINCRFDLFSPAADKSSSSAGFIFRAAGKDSLRLVFDTASDTVRLISVRGDETSILVSAAIPANALLLPARCTVSLTQNRFDATLDGTPLLSFADLPILTYGKIGFFSHRPHGLQISTITIINTAPVVSQVLQVRNMTCQLCEAKIENALKALKGVQDAKADHKSGTCQVTLDPAAPAEVETLIKTIEALGYPVHVEGA